MHNKHLNKYKAKINTPIIGILLDIPPTNDTSYSRFPWCAIRQHYIDAVAIAGGIPILLPHSEKILENLFNLVDGILIPGSDNDIHPKLYGINTPHPLTIINETKTDFEYKILDIVEKNNIPFLGICYGMQLLNVFFGGSLYQHLPDEHNSKLLHQDKKSKEYPKHLIHLKANTLLASLASPETKFIVNSNHHQAIKNIGPNLTISAISEDNIIEAIESSNHSFMLGVEWHPEYLESKLDIAIFNKFIISANKHNMYKLKCN